MCFLLHSICNHCRGELFFYPKNQYGKEWQMIRRKGMEKKSIRREFMMLLMLFLAGWLLHAQQIQASERPVEILL